ncbi:MAG: hypothetical protein KGJ80_10655 [Chloroflexota bacterium]|nr:hypothetical protein [Chloroflexota bacterium]
MNSKQYSVFSNFFWWVFASIVAIAILQFNALLGLAAALVGGVVFGILLFIE